MLTQANNMALHNEQEGSALFHLSPFFFISPNEGGREMEWQWERLWGREKAKTNNNNSTY